jgi:hypothetical protein
MDDDSKMCVPTFHVYPASPEVFLRNIGEWGESFVEVYFIKCPHHRDSLFIMNR